MQDTEDGLSEFPHVILSQARVHDRYLEKMAQNAYPIHPFYARNLKTLTIDRELASQLESYIRCVPNLRLQTLRGISELRLLRHALLSGVTGHILRYVPSLAISLRGILVNSAWG